MTQAKLHNVLLPSSLHSILLMIEKFYSFALKVNTFLVLLETDAYHVSYFILKLIFNFEIISRIHDCPISLVNGAFKSVNSKSTVQKTVIVCSDFAKASIIRSLPIHVETSF